MPIVVMTGKGCNRPEHDLPEHKKGDPKAAII